MLNTKRLVVGITGASGAIYAQRFLMRAVQVYEEIYLTISTSAVQVLKSELDIELNLDDFSMLKWLGKDYLQIKLMQQDDYFVPPASGSFRHDGMVILPCSIATVGRIANGIGNDLMARCAEVCLKERRPLILVPREMPLSSVALRNLTRLSEDGAQIIPACPGWYNKPKSIEDLADTVVARVLQNLGVSQCIIPEWMIKDE